MPTRVFINEPSESVILSYADDFSSLQVSVCRDDRAAPVELYCSDCTKEIAERIESKDGLDIHTDGNNRINLRYKRLFLKKRWVVKFDDVELTGIEVS
jgi:hypothetical protein